jgi:hypothetical protein
LGSSINGKIAITGEDDKDEDENEIVGCLFLLTKACLLDI